MAQILPKLSTLDQNAYDAEITRNNIRIIADIALAILRIWILSSTMTYIWQSPQWPKFEWKLEHLAPRLAAVRLDQGRLIGRVESLGFRTR
ncbi:DUF4172 domain-containing protein, partial [Agrobacterium tumefaciens]